MMDLTINGDRSYRNAILSSNPVSHSVPNPVLAIPWRFHAQT